MKNIFRIVMAVAILFTASCAKEEISSSIGGGEVEVTFTADLGQLGTRAYGEAKNVDRVYLGVYEAGEKTPLDLVNYKEGYPVSNGKASITVVLLKDKKYDLVFWAQNNAQTCYARNWDDRSITVDYTGVKSQNDLRDAFFLVENDFWAGHDETTFELRRPFAQLRAAISKKDQDYITKNGSEILTSKVEVKGVANVIELYTENAEVYGDQTVTFDVADIPADGDKFIEVNGVKYQQLSMNYILVREKKLVDVTYTFADDNTDYTRPYYNVPIQRNYRTNILGQLISSPMDFTVIINPEFYVPDEEVAVWDGESAVAPVQNAEGQYVVATPANLAWLAAAVNGTLPETRAVAADSFKGKTFVLTNDIDLGGNEWTPIGTSSKYFEGTFDGNGKIVSNFVVTKLDGDAGLFGYTRSTIKNLTVRGVNIVAHHYAGAVVGRGYVRIDNCHVENVDITLTAINGDYGDKAGAIIGQNNEGGPYVKNCSANNVTIKGYRDLGGIAGMAHYGNTVSGCSVDNITILQDLSVNYESATPSTLDAVVGRLGRKGDVSVTLENNTVGQNIVIATVVNSAAELQAAVERTNANISIVFGKDIKGDVTIAQSEGVEITIDGNDHNYDGVITVDGKSAAYATAALTIKNVNFVAETISADACIRLGASGNNNTRYTSNVTVENCTFDVAGAVGVKSYTGGDKNLTISNSTATAKAHSLLQAKGIVGLLVKGCEVYSKNGLNFNNSTNVAVEQCVADVKGYAVRFGEGSAANGASETYTIKNSELKSACEEAGDAVIVLRGTADKATLNIENTTLEGAIQIDNQAKAVVKINGKTTVSSVEELNAIPANFGEVVLVGNFDYFAAKSGITYIGENAVVGCINLNGADNVTIKNINFDMAKAQFGYDGDGTKKDYAFSNIITGDNVNKPNKGAHNLVIDGCTFSGTTTKGGAAISFTDFHRGEGFSGNITIKDCTFETVGAYYHIYAHYTGDSFNGHGNFVIENNTFKSTVAAGPVYLGRYASNVPVVLKDNTFEAVASLDYAIYVQDHSNYGVSVDASGNTFAQ